MKQIIESLQNWSMNIFGLGLEVSVPIFLAFILVTYVLSKRILLRRKDYKQYKKLKIGQEYIVDACQQIGCKGEKNIYEVEVINEKGKKTTSKVFFKHNGHIESNTKVKFTQSKYSDPFLAYALLVNNTYVLKDYEVIKQTSKKLITDLVLFNQVNGITATFGEVSFENPNITLRIGDIFKAIEGKNPYNPILRVCD